MSKYKITLSEGLYNKLYDRDYTVFIGQNQIAAELSSDEKLLPGSANVPASILKKSKPQARRKLTESLTLNTSLKSGNTLKLGPVVGVLVARKESNEYPLPTGKEAKIYAEMIEAAAKRNILMYLFYADGVNWEQKTISGHSYFKSAKVKSEWNRGEFPLPDIIYNRIVYRSRERENDVQTFLQKAAAKPIYVFNSRFLNKWEVHKSLYTNPITRTLLPETFSFSKEKLVYCLANYPEFFIKPTGSSVGKGIIKVIVKSPQLFTYYKVGSKLGWRECQTSMQLFKMLGIPEGEKYILQKGIDLADVSGSVFDVRTQVQKDGRGEWQITGLAVRIAAPGKFVTHVPNGGTKAKYEATINEVFGQGSEKARSIDHQLNTIAQMVPRILEKNLGLNLAILSLDIGIDKEGKMWVIEVNSKPASFDEDNIRHRHLSLLNDYLLYKADFTI